MLGALCISRMLIKDNTPQTLQFPDGTIVPLPEMLSGEEQLARQRERSYDAASSQRVANQNDFADPRPRLGRVLHHSEIISRLRQAIPTLHVRDGAPGNIALYKPTPNGAELTYLGYCYIGENPEYSSYLLGANDVPTAERRGWRTTLLRLIIGGHLTESKCLRLFGNPTNGATATYWRRELYKFHNRTRRA